MLFLHLTILAVSFFKFSHPHNIGAPHLIDYYWRDYDGIIPEDAVPGGVDTAGTITYIGQVSVIGNGLLPITISPGGKKVVGLIGGVTSYPTENIKILCSGDLSKIAWIPIKIDEMLLLTNCHLISGGYEPGSKLHIGRVNHDGVTVIGRVFSPHSKWKGLWVPNGAGQINYVNFEILAYGCQIVNYCKNVTEIVH